MMRSIVPAAVVVCSVPKTRWPVSAVSMAMDDRLEIAQLADEDDVRILAQRGAQRALERAGVHADLALRDDALLVRVHELDRVLDRDDVIAARAVDEVDQRAERRRLARPGRAGDEHEALVELAELLDLGRDAHLLHRDDGRGNLPEDGGRPATARTEAEAGPSSSLRTGRACLASRFGSRSRARRAARAPRRRPPLRSPVAARWPRPRRAGRCGALGVRP